MEGGFKIDTIQEGNGTIPKKGQQVVVHFTGTLTNGKKFDSSVDRQEPFVFTLGKGEVIRGWDQAFSRMSVGQKARITCPPDYAYGNQQIKGLIPKNSTLIFEVELLDIK